MKQLIIELRNVKSIECQIGTKNCINYCGIDFINYSRSAYHFECYVMQELLYDIDSTIQTLTLGIDIFQVSSDTAWHSSLSLDKMNIDDKLYEKAIRIIHSNSASICTQ